MEGRYDFGHKEFFEEDEDGYDVPLSKGGYWISDRYAVIPPTGADGVWSLWSRSEEEFWPMRDDLVHELTIPEFMEYSRTSPQTKAYIKMALGVKS